jgi:hypothetical protein
VEADLHALVNSALYGRKVSDSNPEHFKPWERAVGTHVRGGWTGLSSGLDTVVRRIIFSSGGNRTRFYSLPVRSLVTAVRLSYEISAVVSGRHYVKSGEH